MSQEALNSLECESEREAGVSYSHRQPRANAAGAADAASSQANTLPAWLTASSAYEPPTDRDSFIRKSLLSVTATLKHLRLDDGASGTLSPSAPFKLIAALVLILLNSLSSNFTFTFTLMALVIARAAALPAAALKRAASVSVTATLLAFVIMLPAIFLGQPRSAVLIGGKTLVSTLLIMEVSLTTPAGELTQGLRSLHVPALFILTLQLALKNIVALGTVATDVLQALSLRSVGRNNNKNGSIGAVGGIVLLKTKEASEDTYAAMTCRGFDGEYTARGACAWRTIDIAWALGLCALIGLFFYLQGFVA